MSTITRDEIRSRLKKGELVLTPLLSAKQIGDASVDVRLANQFIVFRMHTFGHFQIAHDSTSIRRMQERHVVQYGKPFVLHPGMLALGSTLEYVKLPNNLESQVEGRSSWARLGLEIATATSIEPGFQGVVTLELSNVGTIPLELFPGVRIAQLVFRTATPEVVRPYSDDGRIRRKYRFPIGPEFSKLPDDRDAHVFRVPPDLVEKK